MIVLAVDPGGRNTGIVVRERDHLLAWRLEVREGPGRMPTNGRYMRQVVGACVAALREASVDPADRDGYVVGVEGLADWPERDPKKRRSQTGIYATALVLGAVLLRWPDAVIVDSGRNVAKLHPLAYPHPIRGTSRGMDSLKDVRAAWDHSHAAETLHLRRVREARP